MQNRIYFKLAPSPHASQLPITFKLKCTWNFNFKMHAKVKIAYFFPDCSTTVTKVIHYAWNWNQLLENRWIIVNPMLFHLKPLLEYFSLFKLWEYKIPFPHVECTKFSISDNIFFQLNGFFFIWMVHQDWYCLYCSWKAENTEITL